MAGRNGQAYLFFLIPVGLLLSLSLTVSLMLFGIDRALYSWTFFSHRLAEAGTVLSDEEVREELADELTDSLVKELGQGIPYEVRISVKKSARETFSKAWIVSRSGEIIKAFQGFLKGKRSSLDYALPLGTFKSSLEGELRQIERIPARQVESAMREIPSQVLLSEILGTDELALLERHVRTYPLYINGIMYGLPCLFILLTFIFKRVSWGGIAMGASFVLSSAVVFLGRPLYLSRGASALANYLPANLRTPFLPLIQAALEDYGDYLDPALLLTLTSGLLIIPGAVFLEKALVSGRLLAWMNKITLLLPHNEN